MKILHVLLTRMDIPPKKYGGTERVLWALIQGQSQLGHEVKILVKESSSKDKNTLIFNPNKPIEEQVEGWADVIHFHSPYDAQIKTPFICTEHGNSDKEEIFPINTVYLSSKHAENHNADRYVHNGLYWPDYGEPNLDKPKNYIHFLAKASWKVKNLQGSIDIAKKANIPIKILGGNRFNIKRNPYLYISSKVKFYGMVGGEQKNELIRNSKVLLFPVLWHEPFGLAITESLYLGCPVFATKFGSLPDIINRSDIGFLSNNKLELIDALGDIDKYDRKACHYYAVDNFSHLSMAKSYQECYEKVINNETLNKSKPRSKVNIKGKQQMDSHG